MIKTIYTKNGDMYLIDTNIFYKWHNEREETYILYNGDIFKAIKHNEGGRIIQNITTKQYFKISWGLYNCLYKFKTEAEATEKKKQTKNLYILKEIERLNDYNGEGILNYTYGEKLKPYNTKRTREKTEKPF